MRGARRCTPFFIAIGRDTQPVPRDNPQSHTNRLLPTRVPLTRRIAFETIVGLLYFEENTATRL